MNVWSPMRFVAESKRYMSYPQCNRLSFWVFMPRAITTFYWLCLYESLRELTHAIRHQAR